MDNDKLNYLNVINMEHNFEMSDVTNANDDVSESTQLLSIIFSKWEQEKIKQSNYTGIPDRYIPVTNLYSCPRLVVYSRLGYQPDINITKRYPHTILINNVGQFIHDDLAKLLGNYETTKQYFQNDEYKIRGKCDGILRNALLEFKTVEELPLNVSPIHILQSKILFDLAINNGYSDLDLIKIIYIKRNLKQFKEYNIRLDVEANKEYVIPYYKNGLEIWNCIQKKTLPNKINQADCFFCPYQNICEYNKAKNVKIQTSNVKIVTESKIMQVNNSEQIKSSEVKSNDILWA